MSNPFLDRQKEKGKQSPAYWRSKKQEKELAGNLGGHRISGSGSGKRKGDVRKTGVIRIEAKSTQKKSFSVTREMVEKIVNASVGSDEIPAIVVEFLDGQGNPEESVAVVPIWVLEEIINGDST